MKKIMIIILISLTLTGCKPKENNELKVYNSYINKLKDKEVINDKEYPFNINIQIEKITDEEIIYVLRLDEFKEKLYNIETIILHNSKTEDIFPSIGIFDDKLNLPNEKQKGILLVGYIDFNKELKEFHTDFKVYIKCKDKNDKIKEYFFIKQI